MLELTPGAAAVLAHSKAQSGLGDDIAIRISGADSSNGGAAAYRVRFESHPSPNDLVVETAGTRVFLAAELVEPLQAAVLDVEDTPQGTKLVLKKVRR